MEENSNSKRGRAESLPGSEFFGNMYELQSSEALEPKKLKMGGQTDLSLEVNDEILKEQDAPPGEV